VIFGLYLHTILHIAYILHILYIVLLPILYGLGLVVYIIAIAYSIHTIRGVGGGWRARRVPCAVVLQYICNITITVIVYVGITYYTRQVGGSKKQNDEMIGYSQKKRWSKR